MRAHQIEEKVAKQPLNSTLASFDERGRWEMVLHRIGESLMANHTHTVRPSGSAEQRVDATTENVTPLWGDVETYRFVGSVMRRRVISIRSDKPLERAASLMARRHLHDMPVVDHSGALVGMLSVRDLVHLVSRRDSGRRTTHTVADLMGRDLHVVTPATKTLDALRTLRTISPTCLPVIDGGKLVGVVTERDLLLASSPWLDDALSEAV